MPRSHSHSIELAAPPEKVFAILHTPSAVRAWWQASRVIVLPGVGGTWMAAWGENEDDPEYVTVARMDVFDPPRRIRFADYRYHARTGPLPFDAEFVTEFVVEPSSRGSTLRVIQSGFPDDRVADEFYAGCEKGWHDTFESIRAFMERDGR